MEMKGIGPSSEENGASGTLHILTLSSLIGLWINYEAKVDPELLHLRDILNARQPRSALSPMIIGALEDALRNFTHPQKGEDKEKSG